ncbi:conserved hypothetical protein [Ancylobacter novellus DSM 506]|uniref:DUF2267 domain-containing protein n=1 Tax=Ancylobacter novellus (strain ATCC 8093 / DSM 506 / JCM 20403 / CCM 1077 / IAM 12100 / NBRC 12443 / NCIMB 10456) TaxID=639283 RepID=D7A7R4_ANCN5|nr:DUF2267 domain-containing protein [Ancylobacter novellus]ADH88512.1 conserved hypothetical protein [Ancylobacter novellus DSM 506]
MSDPHLAVLDHAVQQTNLWLKNLGGLLHDDERHHAYSALRAVLHALRDRLPPESVVQLGAQFPLIVRGIYYEGWHLAGKPQRDRDVQSFLDHVARELPPNFPRDALGTTKAVFGLLWRELDPGETTKIIDLLPVPLKAWWPSAAAR